MDEEVRKSITKARTQLILRKPFFGYLSLYLEPRERNDMPMPTMGTDGKYLYYDPEFVRSLDNTTLLGVIAHEVFHCAFGHLWRRGVREPIRWNIAADAATNIILVDKEGFSLPSGAILARNFAGMSAEEIYSKIPPPPKSKGRGGGKGGGKGQDQGEGVFDDHSEWGKEKEEGAGEEGAGKGKEKMEQKWRENASRARQVVKLQGSGMGSLDELVDDLLEPKLNWRELLRNFILSSTKSDYRMVPPAKKHIWRGLYLPSIYGESIEVAVAIDTSGSMSDEEAKESLSEVRALCEQYQDYKVHFYEADYGIQLYEEVTPYTEIPMRIRGRGGTDFRPVFNDITEKGLNISCLVYFTDLLGSFPDVPPPYPVLWIATSGKQEVPFGTVVAYG